MVNFSSEKIENLLTVREITEAVRRGVICCESGDYIVPERMHLKKRESIYLIMPAMNEEYFCTKLVAVTPENKKRKLPTINGTLILNRTDTGQTVAIMNAPIITALRTGAVGALGLQSIVSNRVRNLGIIGLGVQGIWQTIFAASICFPERIYCFSRTEKQFEDYKKMVLSKCPDLQLLRCESADEVVRNSEVIYTCTSSLEPVFSNNKKLTENKRFISVGSFRKDMQELPDVVYENADGMIIDSPAARQEVGDVRNIINKRILKEEQICTLGEVLSRKRSFGESKNIVFKSVGMAAFDLALAQAVYEKYCAVI